MVRGDAAVADMQLGWAAVRAAGAGEARVPRLSVSGGPSHARWTMAPGPWSTGFFTTRRLIWRRAPRGGAMVISHTSFILKTDIFFSFSNESLG